MTNNVLFITLAVVSALEAIVIIIGNAFAIFVFWSQRLSLRRTCFLLINLAIADLIVGITEPVVLATVDIPNSKLWEAQETEQVEKLSLAFQHLGSNTSVFFSGSHFLGTCFQSVKISGNSSFLSNISVWSPKYGRFSHFSSYFNDR